MEVKIASLVLSLVTLIVNGFLLVYAICLFSPPRMAKKSTCKKVKVKRVHKNKYEQEKNRK